MTRRARKINEEPEKPKRGRPRKAREGEIDKMTLNAMKKAFGSEEKAWIEVAKLAKEGSVQHMRWLLEYRYGKPKEQQNLNIDTKVNIPVINFTEPKTIDVTHKEIEDNDSDRSRGDGTERQV